MNHFPTFELELAQTGEFLFLCVNRDGEKQPRSEGQVKPRSQSHSARDRTTQTTSRNSLLYRDVLLVGRVPWMCRPYPASPVGAGLAPPGVNTPSTLTNRYTSH